jgi:hypothetical protein
MRPTVTQNVYVVHERGKTEEKKGTLRQKEEIGE